ncbi:hypothetical protein [Moraxella bovis]|uniref:hypothetical protein n=1 Tax=Moraxella bovis TaxID=476 RepID=UPI0009920F7F|nr:hypothetical protein [Moraxella bovis]OOR89826.1 hypothetical protein B0182_06645 [Moraxella bovis]
MKIQYLKPAPNATTGDIKEINTAQAKILIQLGFAKEYDETDSDDGDTGDLFGRLDDNQSTDQEPSETETTEPMADDQKPSKADEVSEQAQDPAENTPTEPATPTETPKPKKTKTKTENN